MHKTYLFAALVAASGAIAQAQEWGDLEGTFIELSHAMIVARVEAGVCSGHILSWLKL